MIEAKDVVRKISTGCGHTQPVFVPCSSCVESHIRAWEAAIRVDVRQSLRDDWNRMDGEVKRVTSSNTALSLRVDSLRNALAKVENENKELRVKLRAAKNEIADLKLCVDTERISKTHEAARA